MSRTLLRFSRRRLLIAICTLLLLLVCPFEITTRLLPPDGMTETVTYVGMQPSFQEADFIEPRDTATIAHVYTALNNGAITPPLSGLFCHTNGPDVATTEITLTWHGLPTQVWSQTCSDWSRTSGGLPDLWDRAPTVNLGV